MPAAVEEGDDRFVFGLAFDGGEVSEARYDELECFSVKPNKVT